MGENNCNNCEHLASLWPDGVDQVCAHPSMVEGIPFAERKHKLPASHWCAAWALRDPADEPRDLPSPTTSTFISGLINELHDRVGKKAFGRVGLTFVIHEGMVSKYEWTDSTTVKPENGGGE